MQAVSIKQLFLKTITAIWMDFLELCQRIKQNFNDVSYLLYSNNTKQGVFLSLLCMCFINGISIPNMFLLSWKWYWRRRKKKIVPFLFSEILNATFTEIRKGHQYFVIKPVKTNPNSFLHIKGKAYFSPYLCLQSAGALQ